MKETITLKDFVRYEIPTEKLDENNIYIPEYYRENLYRGVIYIMEEELTVKNLFLDVLKEESKNGSFFVFRKDVHVEELLIQEEEDYGPVTIFDGAVVAKNIWTGGGHTTFRQDVTVKQTFISVYNHGTTIVKEAIDAEVIISSDHALSLNKEKIKGYTIIDYYPEEYESVEILQSKYYNEWDEIIAEQEIKKAIKKGVSIIKTKPILSPVDSRIAKMQEGKTKKLDLSFLELEDIPDKVWEMDEISILDLSCNNIDTIPNEITNLKNLKKISITDCEFKSFPEILSKLTWLEEIDASSNEISSLPDNFSGLKSLKKLNLADCFF